MNENQNQSEIYNKWNQFTAVSEEEDSSFYQFGTEENVKEIRKRMEKLVLSIELGAWDKAETLSETLKTLLEGSPRELKRILLRLGMAVRKADYEKSMDTYKQVDEMLAEQFSAM